MREGSLTRRRVKSSGQVDFSQFSDNKVMAAAIPVDSMMTRPALEPVQTAPRIETRFAKPSFLDNAWMRVKQEQAESDRRDCFGLMRRDWRNVLVAWLLFHWGTTCASAQPASPQRDVSSGIDAIRMTVEITWGTQQDDADLATGRTEATKQNCMPRAHGRTADRGDGLAAHELERGRRAERP